MTFPQNNLPSDARYWAREVEKRITNLESSFSSSEINNTTRDSQLQVTANNALSAAIAAKEAADAASTAAGDAETAADIANNAISRLQTYQQLNLGGALKETFTGSPVGTIATYSKAFTLSTEGGGSRAVTAIATGTVDLGITSSDASNLPARVYIIQTVQVGSSVASTYTRVGIRKYVTTTNSKLSIYGGGSLTCSASSNLTGGSRTVSVSYAIRKDDGGDPAATWSGEVRLDNVSVGVGGSSTRTTVGSASNVGVTLTEILPNGSTGNVEDKKVLTLDYTPAVLCRFDIDLTNPLDDDEEIITNIQGVPEDSTALVSYDEISSTKYRATITINPELAATTTLSVTAGVYTYQLPA
jgi:hypothetical protein